MLFEVYQQKIERREIRLSNIGKACQLKRTLTPTRYRNPERGNDPTAIPIIYLRSELYCLTELILRKLTASTS